MLTTVWKAPHQPFFCFPPLRHKLTNNKPHAHIQYYVVLLQSIRRWSSLCRAPLCLFQVLQNGVNFWPQVCLHESCFCLQMFFHIVLWMLFHDSVQYSVTPYITWLTHCVLTTLWYPMFPSGTLHTLLHMLLYAVYSCSAGVNKYELLRTTAYSSSY